MNFSKMAKTAGLAAVISLTAGAAFAATATASVNVRTGPGTQYRAIDTLRAGERVGIIDRSGGWCEVNKSGPNGWVSCRYLTSSNSYDVRPGVTIQFGFGNVQRERNHWRDRDWDRNWERDEDGGYWSGPRSSTYSNNNGFFGFSVAN